MHFRCSLNVRPVAHGEGYQRERLDEMTRKSVAVHREDLKKAEVSRSILSHEANL
jgi:hypothetical protein